MIRCLLVCGALLASPAAAADAAAKEKAVRMKTSRQLKEILTELKIKFPKDADKEDLREIAIEKDALSKWEALHPEKKKPPPGAGGGGQTIGKQDPDSMAEMMFNMMDKDKNGTLSPEEMAAMGGAGAEMDSSFKAMDSNGDGSASKVEVAAFFKMISSMEGMGGMGGGAGSMGGDAGGGAGAKPQASQPKSKPKSKPKPADPKPAASPVEEDDDELPSHDEL